MPRSQPRASGLCRLLSAPAGSRTFPTLICLSFSACLNPYPGYLCGAFIRFFPQSIGLPSVSRWSTFKLPILQFLYGTFSRLQLFDNLQTRRFARPSDCSYTAYKMLSSRGFYFSAYLGSLPSQAGDILTARFGQLTVKGLSPF